jgi:hypothetical protein
LGKKLNTCPIIFLLSFFEVAWDQPATGVNLTWKFQRDGQHRAEIFIGGGFSVSPGPLERP